MITYRSLMVIRWTGCSVYKVALKLICNRNSDGKLNLYINEVNPDNRWNDADNAWFASNNNLYYKNRELPCFYFV